MSRAACHKVAITIAIAIAAAIGAGGAARAAEVPEYDIAANCKAMSEAVGTPAMQTGCVRDETDAREAAKAAEVPPDIMARCRADADGETSYVVLWGCLRDALAAGQVQQKVAP